MSELSDASSDRLRIRRSAHQLWVAISMSALVLVLVFATAPNAHAQDIDQIVQELEDKGYYIEPGGDATDAEMRSLVSRSQSSGDTWYFVVLSGPASDGFAADLRERVTSTGNVIVHSLEEDGGVLFDTVDFASNSSEQNESQALRPFDEDWNRPVEYLSDVVDEFAKLTGAPSSTNSPGATSTSSDSGASGSSGGGFPWLLIAIPVLLIGGLWFMSRRGKKQQAEANLDTAQEIRAELQTELDELANDVLVLSGPVDLSENKEAINYYREASDAYLDISDELPDVEKLEHADLRELSELGTRVAHARWQMDAAEAILDGEPIPEKPKVAPPPPVAPAPEVQRRRTEQRRQMPRRQPRARVPYSRSRRRSGGGLLDILIAGAGMTAGRRSGGMFGGGSRSGSRGGGLFGGGSRTRTQAPQRPRGGVFGRSSGSRSTGSRTSTRRSSTSRASSRSRRSTSRRRPRSRR